MNWATFYLICFVVGFAFSFLSFVGGGLRWHLHLPHLHAHGPHVPIGHVGGGTHQGGTVNMSPFNFVTITAFLAWFGGAGYLLTRYSSVVVVLGLGLATVSGLLGATIVFLFLTRVLMSHDEVLDPADYDMVGVLGRVSVPIREGGTGEVIYSQAGTRRACGARSESGEPIAKDTEVVVIRWEKGLAYVRLWSEIAGENRE